MLILLVIMVVIMHIHPVQQPDIVILQVLTADILQKQSINHREVQVVQLQPVIPVEQLRILLVRPDIGLLMVVIAEQQNQLSINLRHLVVQP